MTDTNPDHHRPRAIPDFATRMILGTFHVETWVGIGYDTTMRLYTTQFDATRAVLRMPLGAIQSLTDNDRSSHMLGYALVDHDGPCGVEIETAVTAFFGVTRADQITQEMLDASRRARQWDTTAAYHGNCHGISDSAASLSDPAQPGPASRGDGGVFTIPDPSEAQSNIELWDWLALQDMETLDVPEARDDFMDIVHAQIESMGHATDNNTGPDGKTLYDALYRLADQGAQPNRVDKLRELRQIGDTALVCARHERGWYIIEDRQINWHHIVDQWQGIAESALVWPIDDRHDRVRVAIFDDTGQPSAYEVLFSQPEGGRPAG